MSLNTSSNEIMRQIGKIITFQTHKMESLPLHFSEPH